MELIPSVDLAREARRARRTPREASPYRWGLPWLEDVLPPPVPGSLTVLGAATNVGKTFASLSLARHAADASGRDVVFFSLEDPPGEVGRRLDAGLAHPRLLVAFPERNRLGVLLDAMAELRGRNLGFVWMDYLQLIAYDLPGAWSKAESVGRTVAELKAAAKMTGVPLGLTSQFRRLGPEERNAFPLVSYLKESGDIENQAEVILLLGGKPRGRGVTMELSKAKNAPVGGRMRWERGAGGVLVPSDSGGSGDSFEGEGEFE